MATICKNRIRTGMGANLHIFMNSVKGISDIIRYAELKPDETRVICAGGSSKSRNEAKLPEGFKISSTTDPVKSINFYTATCFEGTDIYDEIGRTYIVCDAHRSNTLLDISTSMIQICGRIRNSQFKYQLTLIYSTTKYDDAATVEEYKEKMKQEVLDAKNNADQINGMTGKFKESLLNNIMNLDAPYISVIDGNVEVDQNMVNLDIVNYKIVHGIYKTHINLNSVLLNNGFKITEDTFDSNNFDSIMSITSINYRDCCEKYNSIKDEQSILSFKEDERLVHLRNICPKACEAVDKLGILEIRRMNYHQSNIHKKLLSTSGIAQDVLIKDELDKRLHKYEPYTIPKIKQILAETYEIAHLKKASRATDLEK